MTATLTILLIASACNGPGSSDGAGDETARNRIVEPVAPEWKLSLVEELRIGARLEGDETELLYRIADVEIGPGGEIYALSSGDRAVQVFSSTGEFLRTWGRGGEGPGEFRDPRDLALAGDTVAVADGERVHFFDPRGRFLNSVWPGGQIGRYLVYSVHSTDPGWVVAVRPMQVAGEEPIELHHLEPREVRYLDPGSGALGEAIVNYFRDPDHVKVASGRVVNSAYSRTVEHGLDREGHVYVTHGPGYEVLVYDAGGVVRRSVRVDVEPVPVTDAMLEKIRRSGIERCEHPARKRLCDRAKYLEQILPARLAGANERVPVFGKLLVAPDGHLLVSRQDIGRSGAPRPHDLISPEGHFLGRIEDPDHFDPMILRDRRILAITSDELGVAYMVKYRVEGRFRES